MSIEAELRHVLEEMQADDAWARLDRDAQLGWLHWIEHSGELPRVRMYDTANRLLEGRNRPPRFVTARAWLRAFFDNLPWW